jgi:hypothetical protein
MSASDQNTRGQPSASDSKRITTGWGGHNICSEPFVNTSVLQINHPIGQWVGPLLVNKTSYSHLFTTGIDLQRVRLSDKYRTSYNYIYFLDFGVLI